MISDQEWSIIRAMLPTKPRGIPRVDDGRVLNLWLRVYEFTT
jgi:transposase